jgi:phosphohistidine phosphatase SixA
MLLYWQRHCEAEYGEQMDPTRELTPTGHAQARMIAKWYKRQNIKPDLLLQSNFKRSQQTAKRISKKFEIEPVTMYQLDPDMDGQPEIVWRAIKDEAKKADAKTVIAVSHGPLVEQLLAYLTGSTLPKQFHFDHGCVAHIETTTGQRGLLHWMVTPKVIARDEDQQDLVTSKAVAEAAISIAEAALSS